MKKFLKIFTVIVALSIGLGAWGISALNQQQSEMEAFLEPQLRDMASQQWSVAVISKYASTDLKEVLSKGGGDALALFSKLGNITQNKGVVSFRSFSGLSGRKTVQIVFDMQFDKGPGQVTSRVSKDGEYWLIDSININSPYLTSLMVKAAQ